MARNNVGPERQAGDVVRRRTCAAEKGLLKPARPELGAVGDRRREGQRHARERSNLTKLCAPRKLLKLPLIELRFGVPARWISPIRLRTYANNFVGRFPQAARRTWVLASNLAGATFRKGYGDSGRLARQSAGITNRPPPSTDCSTARGRDRRARSHLTLRDIARRGAPRHAYRNPSAD